MLSTWISAYLNLTSLSTSWYRGKLKEWGELKGGDNLQTDAPTPNAAPLPPIPSDPPTRALPQLPQRPHRQRPFSPTSVASYDSGYGTDPFRSSWSTTGTNGSSPLRGVSRSRDNYASPLKATQANTPLTSIMHDFPPLPSEIRIVDFDTNISNQHLLSTHNSGQTWPLRNASLNYGPPNTTYQPQQQTNVQHNLYPINAPVAPTGLGEYRSSHAPISRCRLAGNQLFVPTLDLGACQGCEATKAHYIASVAKHLTRGVLIDQLEDLQGRLHESDIFGNTPLHFLASSGPIARHHVKLFIDRKEDLYRPNCDNANFLHVLDPSNLGSELPLLLQEVYLAAPELLQARTYQGKTVLHCILSRNITVDLLIAILPIFQSAKNNINARDNQGLTAMEIFCKNWLSAKDPNTRSHEEWRTLQGVIDVHAPNLKLLYLGYSQITPVTLPPSSSPSDVSRILEGQSPKGRYSGDLSPEAQQLRYREMRSIMVESVHNPFAHDYRGRNGLHCLAHTICAYPDSNVSNDAHRQNLMALLKSGVDTKDYDRLGSTPLHTMLSTCYGGQDERIRSLLINVMLRRADGAPAPEVHMRDRRGEIPLHVACKAGLVACVEVLLCHKSDVDVLNNAGRSVIFEAKQVRKSKALTNPQEAEKIQQCIKLVEKANGFEFPLPLEDLSYNNGARIL
jgi:ankyrin repeat protein